MGNQLLIRAYNVGCGDCFYVKVPGDVAADDFHILIDCGTKGSEARLEDAIKHLKTTLPDAKPSGKKRLDLLVATHRHEDHIKGFKPEWFEDIEVKTIWLSVAMDPEHPQATSARELHSRARLAMKSLSPQALAANPHLESLAALYGVSNDVADDLLMNQLPKANNSKVVFVHSGMPREELRLDKKHPTIHVLAPEKNIDHYYLGKDVDLSLKGMTAFSKRMGLAPEDSEKPPVPPKPLSPEDFPKNISPADFRKLQSRLLSNGLAFAEKDTSLQNNVSVVLLIEWKNRRLLFVGDAEHEGEFREGKHNGSWNVLWEKHRDGHLSKPVDFLKIGHHGSINATPPFTKHEKRPRVSEILDRLLPVPPDGQAPTAYAIVSTEREFYAPIPNCELLKNLAKRVLTTRNYGQELQKRGINPETDIWKTPKALREGFFKNFEEEHLNSLQPLRTDLEFALDGSLFIEIQIAPA